MAKHILHFGGLSAPRHTYFSNRNGGEVRIYPGNWVIIDDEKNPTWRSWIDRGMATIEERVPEGIEPLDESSQPQLPAWFEELAEKPLDLPRGALTLLGPVRKRSRREPGPSIASLSDRKIEQIRRTFMPCDLSGFDYVDARSDRRSGQRVADLAPPFEANFLYLLRLAWLKCRRSVEREIRKNEKDWERYNEQMVGFVEREEAPRELPGQLRARIEFATAATLVKWGVLRKPKLPNRVTIHRQLVLARLDRESIDAQILRIAKDPAAPGTVTFWV